jgi:hypothetical protein
MSATVMAAWLLWLPFTELFTVCAGLFAGPPKLVFIFAGRLSVSLNLTLLALNVRIQPGQENNRPPHGTKAVELLCLGEEGTKDVK